MENEDMQIGKDSALEYLDQPSFEYVKNVLFPQEDTCYKCGMLIQPTCTPNERKFLDRIRQIAFVDDNGHLRIPRLSEYETNHFPDVNLSELVNKKL